MCSFFRGVPIKPAATRKPLWRTRRRESWWCGPPRRARRRFAPPPPRPTPRATTTWRSSPSSCRRRPLRRPKHALTGAGSGRRQAAGGGRAARRRRRGRSRRRWRALGGRPRARPRSASRSARRPPWRRLGGRRRRRPAGEGRRADAGVDAGGGAGQAVGPDDAHVAALLAARRRRRPPGREGPAGDFTDARRCALRPDTEEEARRSRSKGRTHEPSRRTLLPDGVWPVARRRRARDAHRRHRPGCRPSRAGGPGARDQHNQGQGCRPRDSRYRASQQRRAVASTIAINAEWPSGCTSSSGGIVGRGHGSQGTAGPDRAAAIGTAGSARGESTALAARAAEDPVACDDGRESS